VDAGVALGLGDGRKAVGESVAATGSGVGVAWGAGVRLQAVSRMTASPNLMMFEICFDMGVLYRMSLLGAGLPTSAQRGD
jgi:hypothetical protein